MNGIIIDDEHIHELAFKESMAPFGINLSHQDYLDCCAGKTDRSGFKSLSEKFFISLDINRLLQEKASFYLKLFPTHKKTYSGVIKLISDLSQKYILALTSSATRSEVNLITKEYDIYKYFKVTISADEVKKGKPDPEPYLITCKKLNLIPQQCVVIEDSNSGVLSAKSAGCFCIGITTTHTRQDLEMSDLVLDSFSDVEKSLLEF